MMVSMEYTSQLSNSCIVRKQDYFLGEIINFGISIKVSDQSIYPSDRNV